MKTWKFFRKRRNQEKKLKTAPGSRGFFHREKSLKTSILLGKSGGMVTLLLIDEKCWIVQIFHFRLGMHQFQFQLKNWTWSWNWNWNWNWNWLELELVHPYFRHQCKYFDFKQQWESYFLSVHYSLSIQGCQDPLPTLKSFCFFSATHDGIFFPTFVKSLT
jgi:hypothetical protein